MAENFERYRPVSDDVVREQWLSSFGNLPMAAEAFDLLVASYRTPGRYYHTLEHAMEVAHAARQLCDDVQPADEMLVLLAAWAHDAHYNAAADDNEARSGEVAAEVALLMGLSAGQIEAVRNLILVSTHRLPVGTDLEKIICDADLSMLAKGWDGYAADVANIRAELQVSSGEEWHAIRHMILDFFESKDPLFHLDEAASRWSAPAHANFARERSELMSAS